MESWDENSDKEVASKSPFDVLPSDAETAAEVLAVPSKLSLTVIFNAKLPSPVCKELGQPLDVERPTISVSPFDWSSTRKQVITCIICAAAVSASMAGTSYAPCKQQLIDEWGVSDVAVLTGITTFLIGFALGPLFLAPLSEIRGRKPVFFISGVLFVICQLCCAVTRSFPGMLVARFWAGVGCSSYSSLVGGVISDIYRVEERNTPMSIFSGCALFGVGLGPLISGFVAQYSTWRWVFWLQVIADSVIVIGMLLFVPETRQRILLYQERDKLNKWVESVEAQGAVWHVHEQGGKSSRRADSVIWELEVAEPGSIGRLIAVSLIRPLSMLTTEPIVLCLSAWVAFSWAVLYMALDVVPIMFGSVYGFSLSKSGAVFASTCVASIIATFPAIYQERYYNHKFLKFKPSPESPERRLYFTCTESFLLPIGLFMFGWTANASVHWIVPTIAIGFATAGIFFVYLAVFNYLADTYHEFASSALAAQSATRNILSGVLPLVTAQMYSQLNYGPGSSLLGGVAILLCIGPWLLLFFGERIRERSPLAKKLSDLLP